MQVCEDMRGIVDAVRKGEFDSDAPLRAASAVSMVKQRAGSYCSAEHLLGIHMPAKRAANSSLALVDRDGSLRKLQAANPGD